MTIRTAMLGDVGVTFEISDRGVEASSPAKHLYKGNAELTQTKNTGISGVLVIDWAGRHCYFANPYAAIPLREGFFPGVKSVQVQKGDSGDAIMDDGELMFFPREVNSVLNGQPISGD